MGGSVSLFNPFSEGLHFMRTTEEAEFIYSPPRHPLPPAPLKDWVRVDNYLGRRDLLLPVDCPAVGP